MFSSHSSISRYQAFALHLLGSAIALFALLGLVCCIWYPGPLFYAANGVELMTIIVLVDLVLGPLIMLIIFNPKKTSLKFDVACILICQLAFMFYGGWSIFSARPVYIAFVVDHFALVTANEIEADEQRKVKNPIFASLPLFGPMTVGTKEPDDKKLKEDILFGGLMGMGIQNLPQYFIAYENAITSVKASAKPASYFTNLDSARQQALLVYEKQRHAKKKDVLYLPLKNKKQLLIVAVDANTAEIITIL
jgi:hypothetical protein